MALGFLPLPLLMQWAAGASITLDDVRLAGAVGRPVAGDPVAWPLDMLLPLSIEIQKVPFTRSGGVSLGGIQRVTRTDRGFWRIVYRGVPLHGPARRRFFNALGVAAGGMAGLLQVPAWSFDVAPWPAGSTRGRYTTTHSDGTSHSDGTPYDQPAIVLESVSEPQIGETSMMVRIVTGIDAVHGIRFSYEHALYETGFAYPVDEGQGLWEVELFPAVRAAIPSGAQLEVARPTCLVRLASDRAMDSVFSRGGHDRVDIEFVEAVDHWNSLAGAA